MIRHSLLLFAFAVTTATAQPLRFGPAARVAPFSVGSPGGDDKGAVASNVNGLAAYWLHEGELWTESLVGSPPRPDSSTAHSLGVFVGAFADTVNGPIVLDSDGVSTFVRLFHSPESAATVISGVYPDAIECNPTRCLVSIDSGNTLAVVDTDAQLVKVVPRAPVARVRRAWATDPDGFLVLFDTDAIRIDNSGNVRADVKIDRFQSFAAAFNGDRYAVFEGSGAGVTAFTMTVDGQLSSPKSISTINMLPTVVAWNGSEYLLAGPPQIASSIPEFIPPNPLLGLRIGPDLSPIGPQPFEIAPSGGGANDPSSMAWNGNTFYVVWTHTLGSLSTTLPSTTVEGAAIAATGDVVTRDLVSWGSVPQTWPRVALGNQPIVVWSEFDIQSGITTLRCVMDGGHPFTVATGYALDVVPLGQDYLIVWMDGGSTRAATLTSGLTWSEVPLPPFSFATTAVAANRDHWLMAGAMGANVVTVAISHDGTVSPPTVVAALPYVLSLASDGERFFLAAYQHDFILDSTGAPLIDKQRPGFPAQVDFAGGVYGAISGLGTLDRYDRDGNFIGSTKYAVSEGNATLSHMGSRFVVVDSGHAAIIATDGTLLTSDVPVPAVRIARTDSTTSTAVDTGYATDVWGRLTPALFVHTVTIPNTPSHRAVKH